MQRFRKVIWLLIVPILAFGMHKHYISLTKVEFKKEKKVVQVTMKYFLDDIELALENRMQQAMELSTDEENKLANKYLETYVTQKFKIWINNEEVNYAYLGKEYDHNDVYFYLEVEDVEQIESIEIENSMLVETFKEQQNFVKLNIDGVQKTFILVKANVKEMLKL